MRCLKIGGSGSSGGPLESTRTMRVSSSSSTLLAWTAVTPSRTSSKWRASSPVGASSLRNAVRATGVEPDDTPRLAQLVARLGEPLYQQPAPTGYAETEEHWVNSGALLARMNAAIGIAKDCSSVPANEDHARLIDMIDQQLLAGTMSAHAKSVILEQLTDVTDPVQARALAVGLALGGPDFQKQ